MFNVPEFTVSEFSRSIKRTVEDAFGYVRIHGEISGFKRATSGHLYFTLKDEKSLLSAVCFRGSASSIGFEMGDGLQVCASGRITTYEGRSNYQIIIEKLEIAGVGAILEMIEKRRQKLLAEGLFDEIHKKPLPFFPKTIGVITSPTGAVIEDIKHRIEARCPSHVMIYPTLVQGEKAASEIIAGIKYFNRMKKNRPDVLIVARGGGSFEDLLCFSDENLVREVFQSDIPLVSAVGHETDTTLIDYVSDLRAPTPTAAAEIITPILSNLESQLNFCAEKIESLPQNFLSQNFLHLKNLQRYLINPRQIIEQMEAKLQSLQLNPQHFLGPIESKLQHLQISKDRFSAKIDSEKHRVDFAFERIKSRFDNQVKEGLSNLNNLGKILATNHYQEILKRGFALVKNSKGEPLLSIERVKEEKKILIEMSDGEEEFVKFP